MSVFGTNIAVLSAYFYAGTILTLIFCILVGKELFRSRVILYLFSLVLIARTFPRVVFTYWGGIRYGFGILALFFVLRYFKIEQVRWMFLAGLTSAVGFFTSMEIGVCLIAGVLVALAFSWTLKVQTRKKAARALLFYCAGFAAVAAPYFLYLALTHSLVPFLESLYAVITTKDVVINPRIISPIPSNPLEALVAMLVPTGKNFRHMTPSYFYIVFGLYLWGRIKRKAFEKTDLGLIAIAVYGLVMYNTAFRNIWAAQFEMALQPEKILYFLLLERIYFYFREGKTLPAVMGLKRLKLARASRMAAVFLFLLALSSIGYSLQRFAHRFFAFKYVIALVSGKDTKALRPMADVEMRPLNIERGKGMVVPVAQAEEIEEVVGFLKEHTWPEEAVLMYPELGTYSFFADRPFVGRFPIPTFSWFSEKWHREFVENFKKKEPRFVVMIKEFPINWKEVYLGREENVRKYKELTDIVYADYTLKKTTPGSYVYELKKKK